MHRKLKDDKSKANPPWKQFELAVATFLKALNHPKTAVRHDFREADRQTQRPRQRDIWIETQLGGLFTVKILVSCKKLARKLNETDIDHFFGELYGSRAGLGVLYSYSGFNDAALEKAAALNISCCVLLDNQAPSIPEQLIMNAYCCSSQLGLSIAIPPQFPPGSVTWNDIFEIQQPDGQDLLTVLVETFKQLEATSISDIGPSVFFPKQMTAAFQLFAETWRAEVQLTMRWKIYRAKLAAYLLSGTYSFTDKAFVGTLSTPAIDMKGLHPGEGWELIDFVPGKSPIPTITAVLNQPNDVRGQLVQELGQLRLN